MSTPVIVIGVVLVLAAYLLLWCLFVTAKRANEENERDLKMPNRLRVHPFVPQGEMFVMADIDHPEIHASEDWGELDGSVLFCNPDDEQAARDVLAHLSEHTDVNEALTAFRRARRDAK